MKTTAEDVAAFFRKLKPEQMRNDPAIREAMKAAGQAFTRLQERHVAGPGRPPTVLHKPGPPRPRNWDVMTHREKLLWARESGGTCRCAPCRRIKFPSYQHKPYGGKEQ